MNRMYRSMLQTKNSLKYFIKRLGIYNRNYRFDPEYQYIFIHIPKTAGSSVYTALKSLPRKNRTRCPVYPIEHHAKASEVKKVVGDKLWNDYFTFCFVRNPWDLMVSCYHWWLKKAYQFKHCDQVVDEIEQMGNFKNFMRSPYGMSMINEFEGNLADWYMERNNKIVDFVGSVENINNDWEVICNRLGIHYRKLPVINKINRDHYRKFYNNETTEFVANRFSMTIKLFNYQF